MEEKPQELMPELKLNLMKNVPPEQNHRIILHDKKHGCIHGCMHGSINEMTIVKNSNAVILNPSFSLALSRFLLTITTL